MRRNGKGVVKVKEVQWSNILFQSVIFCQYIFNDVLFCWYRMEIRELAVKRDTKGMKEQM